MNEFPTWWFVVSGLFFGIGLIALIAFLIQSAFLFKAIRDVQPSAQRLVERLESAATKLEGLADSAQETVDSVGGSARNVAHSVESVVAGSTQKFETVSSVLMMAMTALKLYEQFQGVRSRTKVDKTPRKKA